MNKKGFTLIELLATIAILAIVATIAVSSFLPLMERARKNSLGSEGISLIDSAKKLYATEAIKKTDAGYDSTQSVCYSLEYLHNKNFIEKSKKENYYGSVLVEPQEDSDVYNYYFWISNGAYTFAGVTRDELSEEFAIDFDESKIDAITKCNNTYLTSKNTIQEYDVLCDGKKCISK